MLALIIKLLGDMFHSFCLVQYFYGFSLFFGTIYSAAKKNMNIAISTAAAALINIFINLILLGRIGVIAATISTAISYFAVGVYRID